MNDIKAHIAKKHPNLLKTLADKASYGHLPDELTVGEIAQLWGGNCLEINTKEWQEVVGYLVAEIKTGALPCEKPEIAEGGIDKEAYETYKIYVNCLRGRQHNITLPHYYYLPQDAPVSRTAFNQWLKAEECLQLIKGLLIANWMLKSEPVADTQGKPSSGKWAIHELIDRAFYSIDKPADKITPGEVFEAIKHEFDNKLAAIDEDNIIKSIDNKAITWRSKSKSGKSRCSWNAFEDAVNRLKNAMVAAK